MNTKTKLFWILWVSSIVSTILILPYIITLQSEALKKENISPSFLILIAILQGGVVFGVAAFFGLILAEKTGFKLPLLSSWVEHKEIEYKGLVRNSAILGFGIGMAIVLIDRFVFQYAVASSMKVPAWQGLLASFYGGICEEVLMRLFLMSLFVFILIRVSKRNEPTPAIVWSSIILISILFGLGHLPITSSVVTITAWVVFRAILLNGIAGVALGWLYWKKGLESAIIAHYSADIIVVVIGPNL